MKKKLVRGTEPIIYLWEGSEAATNPRWNCKDVMLNTGSKHRIVSFMDIIGKATRKAVDIELASGCRVMLDSGAHNFQGRWRKPTQGKIRRYDLLVANDAERKVFQQKYVEYCLEKGHLFDGYINFDWRVGAERVYGVQKELESLGLTPLPTIHGDQGTDWLERYADEGYQWVMIGRGGRRGLQPLLFYLDHVFNVAEKKRIMLHGLGMTDVEVMFRFPWYSVDSATHSLLAAMGTILYVADGKIYGFMVSERSSNAEHAESIRKTVEDAGFDFDIMRFSQPSTPKTKGSLSAARLERIMYNMYVMTHLKQLGLLTFGEGGRKWKSLSLIGKS